MSDRDGWIINPIDESVMGPAQALAREKMAQYRAAKYRDFQTQRYHMNRRVTTVNLTARRRSIAMRVLASIALPVRSWMPDTNRA